MTRAAIYARVSTDEQAEKGTIDTQVEALDRYIAFREWEIVERFLDDGVSGTIPLAERPAGARLLEAVRQKTVDVVLVYKVDRLGRRLKVAVDAVDTIEKAGVGFVSAQENFDTTTSFGKAGLGMSMVWAQLDRDRIVENTTAGRYRRVRNGKAQCGPCPYGYTYSKETGQLTVYEAEAAVVRLMFSLAIDGLGMTAIANRLDKMGVPTPNGKPHPSTWGWHPTSVYRMLQNKRYIGQSKYGKEPMPVPPIVDEVTFAAAQHARLEHHWDSPRNTRNYYMLQHMLHCGVCGARYMVMSRRHPTYQCYKRGVHGPAAGHEGAKWAWRASELDKIVKAQVKALYQDPEKTLARARVWAERMTEEFSLEGRELAELEKRLSALDDKEARSIDLATENRITGEQLTQKLQEVETERQHLQQELQQSRQVTEERDILLEATEWIGELLAALPPTPGFVNEAGDEVEPTPPQWRELIQALVSHITVEESGELTIHLPPRSSLACL